MNESMPMDIRWLIAAANGDKQKLAQLSLVLAMTAVGEIVGKASGYEARLFHYRDLVREIQLLVPYEH